MHFLGALPVSSLHTPITSIFDKDITHMKGGGGGSKDQIPSNGPF